MPFLAALSGPKLAVLASVAVAMGVLAFLWYDAAGDRDKALQALGALKSAHSSTLKALDQVRKDREASQALLDEEATRRERVETLNERLRREIDSAPTGGCVGPAVRSVLNGLYDAGSDSPN